MTNEDLIKQMLFRGMLQSERIADAFQRIDRKDFVGQENLYEAYHDHPLTIGHGQTISQPSTVAFMLEKLNPRPGHRVLDIGSGSGWTTALLAILVGGKGRIIGLERIKELVGFGKKNLAKYSLPQTLIRQSNDTIGSPKDAPFDRILVSAEADTVPVPLLDQLKTGGILVIPVLDTIQVIKKNSDGSLSQEINHGFRFVPLV